jgi:hypothetical protein
MSKTAHSLAAQSPEFARTGGRTLTSDRRIRGVPELGGPQNTQPTAAI